MTEIIVQITWIYHRRRQGRRRIDMLFNLIVRIPAFHSKHRTYDRATWNVMLLTRGKINIVAWSRKNGSLPILRQALWYSSCSPRARGRHCGKVASPTEELVQQRATSAGNHTAFVVAQCDPGRSYALHQTLSKCPRNPPQRKVWRWVPRLSQPGDQYLFGC